MFNLCHPDVLPVSDLGKSPSVKSRGGINWLTGMYFRGKKRRGSSFQWYIEKREDNKGRFTICPRNARVDKHLECKSYFSGVMRF